MLAALHSSVESCHLKKPPPKAWKLRARSFAPPGLSAMKLVFAQDDSVSSRDIFSAKLTKSPTRTGIVIIPDGRVQRQFRSAASQVYVFGERARLHILHDNAFSRRHV